MICTRRVVVTEEERLNKKEELFNMVSEPNPGVDPAFRLTRFPLDGELDFFYYLKNDLLII